MHTPENIPNRSVRTPNRSASLHAGTHYHRLKQTAAAALEIGRVSVSHPKTDRLLEDVCHALRKHLGYELVWIATGPHPDGAFPRFAWCGSGLLDPEQLNPNTAGATSILAPVFMCLRSGTKIVSRNLDTEPCAPADKSARQQPRLGAAAAFPLEHRGRFVGALAVYSADTNAFDDDELEALEHMAQVVAVALVHAEEHSLSRHTQAELLRLATAVEQAAEAVVITDPLGNIQYVNPAFEKITGYSKSEVLGQNPRLLKSGKHPLEFYQELWQTIISGRVWKGNFINKRKDGSLYEEQATIAPVFDDSGRITNFIAIKQDVTDRNRAEAALRESQRQLATLISNLPGMVYRCKPDENWAMEFVSEGARALTEYAPEDLIGNRKIAFAQLILEEDRSDVSRSVHTAIAERRPFQISYRIRTATGQIKWVWEQGQPVLDEHGAVVALEGYIFDNTKRKQAEAAIATEATRRRIMMDSSRDGIVVLDANGRAIETNPAFARMLGYTPEEVLQLHVWDWDAQWPEEHIRGMAADVDAVGHHFETKHRRKDGSILHVEVNTNAVFINGAKHIFCVVRDITERKRREQELAEIARQWQTTFDATNDAIWILDPDRRIVRSNRTAALIAGCTPEQMAHKHCWELMHGTDAPPENCPFLRAMASLRRETVELKTDGHWFEITVDPILDRDGAFIGAVHIATDVTQRKQLEAQLLRAQRLEAIGALASGVAHDLNNILSPILMAVPMLRESTTDPEALEILKTVESCAERGAGIVKQLLTFARGRPGAFTAVSPKHIIQEIAALTRETFPKTIQTRVSMPEQLWPIMADPVQVHQALTNLCVNARDAMPQGGTLRLELANESVDEMFASMVPGAKPGPYVRMSVIDTGVGIPPEHLDKVFDPFFTTKEEGKGTGLGLATVQNIMRGHGGFVRLTSKPGAGTQVDLYFPAAPQAQPADLHPAPKTPPQGNGQLVLIVDDEASNRELIKRVLEKNGYTTLVAATGYEAIAIYSEWQPQIRAVITDIMMPGMQGTTLIDAVRNLNPHVPILAITGMTELAKLSIREQPGSMEVLLKPFDAFQLLSTLHRVISQIRISHPVRSK